MIEIVKKGFVSLSSLTEIKSVEAVVVAMPLKGVFTSGGKSKNTVRGVVVKIIASDGSMGISSVDPSTRAIYPNRAEDLAMTIKTKLAPLIIGLQPTNVNRILKTISPATEKQLGARAAIELACVDLTSRILGISICDYLGGAVRDKVYLNGWIGELRPDDAVVEARLWVKRGFKSLKVKVGSNVRDDITRVIAVREAIGNEVVLRMDANEQYSTQDALKLCRGVRNCELQLFEQPVKREDLDGLLEVRRLGGIAIMADESIGDHRSLLRVIKADCSDFVKFGIAQAGGITVASEMISTAKAAGQKVVMGHGFGLDLSTMAELLLGFSSSNILPGLECVGPLKVTDTITPTGIDISKGFFSLPEGSGLTIDIDEKKLLRYEVT